LSKQRKQRRTSQTPAGKRLLTMNTPVASIDLSPPDECEQLFRMARPAKPRYAGIEYSRGFIDYRTGSSDPAGAPGGQATLVETADPSYHYVLANALVAEGRIADATAQYERAISLKPDFAEAHNNLGAILNSQGKLDDAVAHYRRALVARPGYADAHANLGLALAEQSRIAEAIAHFQRALALDPGHVNAHNNLGLALAAQGRFSDAEIHFARVLELNPGHPSAHLSLATALLAQRRMADAIPHLERALELNPDNADLHNNLGVALMARGRSAEAAAHYERALELNPSHADAHGNLGTALAAQGSVEDASAHLERALQLNPAHADAHNSLGNICKDDGRFPDALAHYGRAIAIRPDYGEALLNRSEIKSFHSGDADLAALEALACRDDLSVNKKLHIHFALAKALEDTGEYARSFDHLRLGNALKRGQVRYDETGGMGFLRRIAAVFDRGLLDRFQAQGDPSPVPIFVLGMPRSGSTLIEQILASHPQIHGAGELVDFEAAATSVLNGRDRYPECVPDLDSDTLRRIGQAYLARLPAVADGKTRIVDKLPGNFLNIGLIRLFLPNARIIHTMRNPIDTCVSCYSKLFTSGHNYTYDLAELGRFYRGYSELMAHWRSVLPQEVMLDVFYEDVVDYLDGQARRLVDYCGLPWDERCLSFHKTRRPVRTASAIQVRQPLYRTSIDRWRSHETEIGPLLAELSGVAR